MRVKRECWRGEGRCSGEGSWIGASRRWEGEACLLRWAHATVTGPPGAGQPEDKPVGDTAARPPGKPAACDQDSSGRHDQEPKMIMANGTYLTSRERSPAMCR